MKFVCDRCGKKYATADDPAPGKVYKLKCKACGHLIVVRAQAGTSTALPAVAPPVAATQGPEIELDVEPDAAPPAAPPAPEPMDDAVVMDAPLPPEVATAIDGAAPIPAGDALPPPPPPDKDELADFAAAAAEVMASPAARPGAQPYVDLFADGVTGEGKVPAPPAKADDPFAAAARASLPEGYVGSGAPSPFAAPAPTPPPAPAPRAAPPPPKVAPAARPALAPAGKPKGLPVALIGAGVAVLLAIGAFAVFGGKHEPPPAPAPAPVAKTERPAPAPAPEPVKVVEPEPARAEPAPEPAKPKPPPPAVAERKPEPKPEPKARPAPPPPPPPVVEKKPEPRPEPPKVAAATPTPPPPAEKPEPKTETRDVTLPEADAALTPEVVQKVIGANRKAFASCIAASQGSGIQLDGRKVALRLTVNSNGAVTYPTLDDQTLNPTEMGQCLKSAARLMIFPKFKGDPMHVEVPLTLSAN